MRPYFHRIFPVEVTFRNTLCTFNLQAAELVVKNVAVYEANMLKVNIDGETRLFVSPYKLNLMIKNYCPWLELSPCSRAKYQGLNIFYSKKRIFLEVISLTLKMENRHQKLCFPKVDWDIGA